jgi:hypothetical protein
MNQYLDQKDGKWHLTISVDVPRLLIKNKLNFRVYNVTMKSGEVIRDPSFNLSSYIFSVAPSFMGKKVFFSSYFEPKEIEEVVEFKFGFCDERVRWHENTIIIIKNNYIKPNVIDYELLTQAPKLKEDTEVIKNPELDTKTLSDLPDILSIVNDADTISTLLLEIASKEMPPVISEVVNSDGNKKTYSKKVGRKKK